ncbi:MAG TPA: hypothetical protein VM364_11740 [Vicinamibacterales bacterium]|nr:hypothetical protein [Vicinamibacterales bacterium]
MSRVGRASIAAAFVYVRFALSIIVGIAMVPLILNRVDVAVYGLWLATGEVLAYAALADLGMLGILSWVVAQADGRNDRSAMRSLLANGASAAGVVSLLYIGIVVALWQFAPASVLTPEHRAAIGGPLAVMALTTAIVLPLRVAHAALAGLQDVRFCGSLATVAWLVDVTVTAALLLNGFGLYALAFGASVPALLTAGANVVRLRRIAPDLLRGWPKPTIGATVGLMRDGFGGWLGAWGWRLSAATDGIVVGYLLGYAAGVTRLAMTSKLAQIFMQLSWVPGDSGLVGLSQLSGEGDRTRLRAAVTALFRMHLTLAGAGACIVLVLNAAFVQWWLPEGLFGGRVLTIAVAGSLLAVTGAHAFATIVSVLGRRMTVGVVALASGIVQVGLAYLLAKRFDLPGLPAAAIVAQVGILYPLLLRHLGELSGLTPRLFLRDVVLRWMVPSVPLLTACAVVGSVFWTMPVWIAAPLAAAASLVYLWATRHLLLDYAPVAALVRKPLARLRLERLIEVPAEHERVL